MGASGAQLEMVQQLEKQIAELERFDDSAAAREEIERLKQQLEGINQQIAGVSNQAWDRVLLARHPQRPYTLDWMATTFAFLGGYIPSIECPTFRCWRWAAWQCHFAFYRWQM